MYIGQRPQKIDIKEELQIPRHEVGIALYLYVVSG
jgi:hypothetical protein